MKSNSNNSETETRILALIRPAVKSLTSLCQLSLLQIEGNNFHASDSLELHKSHLVTQTHTLIKTQYLLHA